MQIIEVLNKHSDWTPEKIPLRGKVSYKITEQSLRIMSDSLIISANSMQQIIEEYLNNHKL